MVPKGRIEIEMLNDFNTRAHWDYVTNGCIYALLPRMYMHLCVRDTGREQAWVRMCVFMCLTLYSAGKYVYVISCHANGNRLI